MGAARAPAAQLRRVALPAPVARRAAGAQAVRRVRGRQRRGLVRVGRAVARAGTTTTCTRCAACAAATSRWWTRASAAARRGGDGPARDARAAARAASTRAWRSTSCSASTRVEPPASLADRAAWMQAGETQIHLMWVDEPVALPRGHVAVVARGLRRDGGRAARAPGYEVEPRAEHWGAARSYVRDPAGNLVEVMARATAGSGLRRSSGMASAVSRSARRFARR